MHPSVSVIIASYNYRHYLPTALDSVLSQTITDWELIVIDDGSTDNSSEVIRPYLNDCRIRYHRTCNRGQPAAENMGIHLSTGKYIAFLDADDIWLPDKLELQLAIFDKDPDLGIVYSRRININPQGTILSAPDHQLFRGMVLEQMFRQNFVCFSSSMIKKEVFNTVGDFNEEYRHGSDYDLWLRAAIDYRFNYVDEPLVLYRKGHANLTSHSDIQLLSALKVMDSFLNLHPHMLPASLVRRSYAETYYHLAYYLHLQSRIAALPWNLRAIAYAPLMSKAWLGLAKLCVPKQFNYYYHKLHKHNSFQQECIESR
jgi:glycosyltransferase involved in cell wall biosynthesis